LPSTRLRPIQQTISTNEDMEGWKSIRKSALVSHACSHNLQSCSLVRKMPMRATDSAIWSVTPLALVICRSSANTRLFLEQHHHWHPLIQKVTSRHIVFFTSPAAQRHPFFGDQWKWNWNAPMVMW
jgi:hypothetical protein